ncbi:MAG TPA: hypothetical protein VIV11_10010 [Kofleriaceae bacterium]
MRWLIALSCACGGSSPNQAAMPESPPPTPISVEWKVEQGDGNQVNVALAINGTTHAIGPLEAATELEAGTPSTCALRAASPNRTEIVCGDANSYAAVLGEGTVIVSLIAGEQRTEVKRVPVAGDVLAVKMLVLPGSKL